MTADSQPTPDPSPADPIEELVRKRWAAWYPEMHSAGAELTLARLHSRRHSTVHEFAVAAGPRRERFFVKCPDPTGGRSPDRPYSVPDFAIPDRHRRQAEALDALGRAIGSDDPTLAAVRVVDVIDSPDLVVTDAAAGRPLRDMLLEQVRWSLRRAPDLGPTFAHTGRLLRIFHHSVPSSGPTFGATRSDFLDICSRLTEHLANRSERSAWFGDVDRRVRQLAEQHLSDQLDVVTRFGDFGLTNVFATPAHRVTAIDTLAACRMPALHDITYLITGMHLLRPQVASMGLALPRTRIERYERAFVEGYYEGRDIPWAAFRVWSVVRALERWSAKSLRHEGGIRGRVIGRYLQTWVDDQLDRSRAGV